MVGCIKKNRPCRGPQIFHFVLRTAKKAAKTNVFFIKNVENQKGFGVT